jgi:flagellin
MARMPKKQKFREVCKMIINHNLNAMNAHRQLGIGNANGAKSMEKLSSGLRINRAGDDAAGLSISEKMRGQIRGLNQASRNSQDGISLIQTAEGALNETHAILQRMRELAVQSANDTNEDIDRTSIQNEINELAKEIDRIGNDTEFNEKKLLNGDLSTSLDAIGTDLTNANGITNIKVAGAKAGFYSIAVDGQEVTLNKLDGDGEDVLESVTKTVVTPSDFDTLDVSFSELGVTVTINAELDDIDANNQIKVGSTGQLNLQIGANEGQNMTISIADMTTAGLNLDATALDVSDHDAAGNAVTQINAAIQLVSNQRSELGAYQNRLEHTIKNLDNASENLQASESRIRDVDMAKEMMEFTKNNILQQAAQAMLAQANQAPQGVLQLLR